MKDHEIRELVNQLRDIAIKYHGAGQLREQIAHVVRAAMLQDEPVTTANKLGSSPVIPDGYVMVPKEPTGKQWAAGVQAFDSGMDKVTRIYQAMLAAAPQEVNHG
ncbi:TPA: hypothetical protein ACHP1R_005011 [Raoultella ornithinolytica]